MLQLWQIDVPILAQYTKECSTKKIMELLGIAKLFSPHPPIFGRDLNIQKNRWREGCADHFLFVLWGEFWSERKKNSLLSSVGALRVFFPAAKFLFGEKAWPASERGKGRDLVLLLKLLIILNIYWKVLFVYMSDISSEADSSGKCELSSKWSTHILTSKTSSGSPLAFSYCWGLPSSSPLPWDGDGK